MESYNIIDLLIFLKNQQQNEYRGIQAIFEVLEDERIPEDEKMIVVLSLLQQLGLKEQFSEEVEFVREIPSGNSDMNLSIPFRVDRWEVQIMNAIVIVDIVLN